MILAGIDIGTNTLRLLIAETGPDTFSEIHADRRITRLGEDLDRTGRLSPDAQKRSIEVLADFSASVKRHGAAAVSAVGTSALRNAENTAAFASEVFSSTGLRIRVITGEVEARLTLLGVARALKGIAFGEDLEPVHPVLVIDIGGGSTEIITAGRNVEPRELSLPLGAVYMTERFIKHDPPLHDELALLRSAVRKELETAGIRVESKEALLAGTAGTITTLAAIKQQLAEYDPDRINRSKLSRESIDKITAKLAGSTLKERRDVPGLERGREDIILAGSVIIQEIMDRFGFDSIIVSDWGLREGIVFDLYGKQYNAHPKLAAHNR